MQIQNRTEPAYAEFAIMANTTNWVGFGMRPTANRSQPSGLPTYKDTYPWLVPAPKTVVLGNASSSKACS